LSLEEKKKLLRYLLRTIFFDDCSDINEDKLVSFYSFLLDKLEIRSDIYVSNDSDDYFVVESVVQLLSHFHLIDSSTLFYIVKNPDNFKEVVMEQTGLSVSFVEDSMERLMSDFQGIKQDYFLST